MDTVEQALERCRNEREARRVLGQLARSNGRVSFEEALALAGALHRWSCRLYYSYPWNRERPNREGRTQAYGLVIDLVGELPREQIGEMVEAIVQVEVEEQSKHRKEERL